MNNLIYISETRSFAKGGNGFLSRNRTAVKTVGGALAGTAIARMRTKRQLDKQGIEKGSDEYNQKMRRATAVGATAGAAIGFGADVAGRYRNAKAANIASGMDKKTAGMAAKRQTVGGIFGNKETRQSLTAKSNAQNGVARQMNKQNRQANRIERKMTSKGKSQGEIQAKLQSKKLTQQQINQGVTNKVQGRLQNSNYYNPNLQYKMGGQYGRTGQSVDISKPRPKPNPSQSSQDQNNKL